ncbi:3' terminal RNA ribose 2'-O-methyltransferase Hen1 [Nocardioides sp. 1609]|uniref:3' terminal RNA ribose 2'-O-methyltransferase Hen1 n=1 Tax=Nocardioides sp. 1609 TaxID=2508327 RepID=UPI00106FCFEF|nr:3' terminal RNA ribose 2'-O-methyltransferase Hen1 [Nocardioides sp. 1609]
MLLTVTTTARDTGPTPGPATDLGYLLHKHPERVQQFTQSFGTATVFYPEADDARCTAAVLLEIDPVRLARTRGRDSPDFSLGQYVNDRPYAASSLLGVAVADVFSTARAGRCAARQELADHPIPLEIRIPVLPCRGGPDIAHRLFEPLGWSVTALPVPLDPAFPEWGDSRYVDLTITGHLRLADALGQLHVLLPVLDEAKHYWQGTDEIDKLLRSGGDWLTTHPERELVARRYLARTTLTRAALARLAELDDGLEEGRDTGPDDVPAEVADPRRVPLAALRRDAVVRALLDVGAESVIDLGCGGGALLRALVGEHRFTRIAGVDVSSRSLEQAARVLRLESMSERQAERVTLFQGALTYEDQRLGGYDAAVLMEVVEHVDPSRLAALEHVVLGAAAPASVVVTTPNAEYNVRYEELTGMRHPDHRFEWTRAEFAAWCDRVAGAHGYTVELRGIGEPDETLGAPTQMGVFTRG